MIATTGPDCSTGHEFPITAGHSDEIMDCPVVRFKRHWSICWWLRSLYGGLPANLIPSCLHETCTVHCDPVFPIIEIFQVEKSIPTLSEPEKLLSPSQTPQTNRSNWRHHTPAIQSGSAAPPAYSRRHDQRFGSRFLRSVHRKQLIGKDLQLLVGCTLISGCAQIACAVRDHLALYQSRRGNWGEVPERP
ncbi:MAG: hypothetical protein RLZZ232_913 [Planctomycetota bacterium]